jgi:flagellar motility protein MotE (MotC chaperone)
MMKDKAHVSPLFGRGSLLVAAACLSLAVLPGAHAQQQQAPLLGASQEGNPQQEIQQYCGSIVDPARDQRYLLQKQELDKLQADVNERINTLEARKAEYEDWLKRRNAFLQKAKAGLVDIYKTSKADEAAQQFDEMDINIAAAIIMQLPARQSGLILSEMDAKKAAMVAAIMSSAVDPTTSRDPS